MRGYWTDLSKTNSVPVSPSLVCRKQGSNSSLSNSASQNSLIDEIEAGVKSNRLDIPVGAGHSKKNGKLTRHQRNGPVDDSLESCNSSSSLLQDEEQCRNSFSSTTRNSIQLAKNRNNHKRTSSSEDVSPTQQLEQAKTIKKKKTKRPVITEEMLEKHSIHFMLMHNFFLSDSDVSQTGQEITVVKKVRFNVEPEVLEQREYSDFAFIEAGSLFQTRWETLERHGETLLGSEDKWQYYDDEEQRFTFDVIKWISFDQQEYPGVPDEPVYIKPECFESILFYYQDSDDTLRCPKGVKTETFMDTLKFFKINSREISVGPYECETDDDFDDLVPHESGTLQSRIFLLLYHKSSLKTRVYTLFDIIFIITSVISCISATLPMHKPPEIDAEAAAFFSRFGAVKVFVLIDGVCIAWFFVLFILHFLAAPVKFNFFTSFQTVIDIIILTAFSLFIAVAHTDLSDNIHIKNFLRLTFSFRILRLSRHSLLLNSLGIALKEASRELISVTLFLFVIVFLFGCLEYFMEVKDPAEERHLNCTTANGTVCNKTTSETEALDPKEDTPLSMLEYVWWSLITITTVGYGTPDIHTTAGKIVGGMCAIAGVPLFAIPIPILSKHLERVYQRELRKNEYIKNTMVILVRGDNNSVDDDGSEEDEELSWNKIVGERRKSMGPQFSMTHFRP